MENALEAIHPQMLQPIPKTFFRIVSGMGCGITRNIASQTIPRESKRPAPKGRPFN
jgi:hypothetical protein